MNLECNFKEHNFRHGTFKLKVYTCCITAAKIVEPGTTIQAFKGKHFADKGNRDVKAIVFENCDVNYFPRGLHANFPQLRVLHIVNCGLATMTRDDLIGLHTLEILNIVKNKLECLPTDLFEGMPRLKVIIFKENKINFMNSDILKPLNVKEIKVINVQGNKSIDAYYASERPGRAATIEELIRIIDKQCTKPESDANGRHESDVGSEDSISTPVKDKWESNKCADFTIIAGSKEFEVHKFVLAQHSSKVKEQSDKKLYLKSFSAQAIEKCVHYLYTGEAPKGDSFELYKVSSELEVLALKSCEEEIMANTNEANCTASGSKMMLSKSSAT